MESKRDSSTSALLEQLDGNPQNHLKQIILLFKEIDKLLNHKCL